MIKFNFHEKIVNLQTMIEKNLASDLLSKVSKDDADYKEKSH